MKPVNVFITIDTEHSIGGAFKNPDLTPVGNDSRIYGIIGRRRFGIPMIMDIADHYGLRTVFFVEALNKYYFGEKETAEICAYISGRNHDIQLHIHPNYLNFTCENPGKLKYSDFMADYSFERQVELLQEARQLFAGYGVKSLNAFRAGCYGADLNTLKALKETGFLIDSSFARSYCNETCFIPETKINDLAELEGIYEFPITSFIEKSHVRSTRFMPMDINGVSFREMRYALDRSNDAGPGNIVIILHSFSFIKAYDVQYTKVRPRAVIIRRFKKLCRFLAENKNRFNVMTFSELTRSKLADMAENSRHNYIRVPSLYSLARGIEQVRDNLA